MIVGEESAKIASSAMEVLLHFLTRLLEKEENKSRYGRNALSGSDKKSKIKIGELSKHNYNKMMKKGEQFRMVEVPTKCLEDLEHYANKLGASYYVLESNDGRTLAAVSEKSFAQFSDALKMTTKDVLSSNSVNVMNGDNLIPAEQKKLAEEIFSAHDIPIYSFESKDGSLMNVVPKEYSGQYKAALKTLEEASESVKDVKIASYIQSENMQDIRIKKISEDQAKGLAREFGAEKVSFIKYGGEAYAKFSAEIKDEIEKNIVETDRRKSILSAYETATVKGAKNYVTIDKKTLGVKENGTELFMKIPKTDGQDYISLPKKDIVELNGGKTLKYSIEKEKFYDVLDANGNICGRISGVELEKHYENRTEKLFGGKDTQIVHYDVSGNDRVEIYDKANDKIISIGSDSLDKAESILLENGINSEAAKAISDKLNNANETEIYYSEEDPEDEIRRTEAAEAVENMEQYGDMPRDSRGVMFEIYDEESKKYTVVDPEHDSGKKIRNTLINAGYTEIQAAAIMSKLDASRIKENVPQAEQSAEIKSFPGNNAELNNFRYCSNDSGIAIVKTEKNENGEDIYKYVTAEKGASRNEIEAAVRGGLAEDEKTVAGIMKCFDNEKLIPVPEQIIIPSMGYKVSLVSSQTYELSKNGVSISLQKGKADIPKTAAAFGITEKQAEKLTGKIEKAMNSANKSPSFLSQLRHASAGASAKDKTRDNVHEKDKPEIPEGRLH